MHNIFSMLYNTYEIKSMTHLDRYKRLIQHYVNNPCIQSAAIASEKHHILPRAMFPECIKDKDNVVVLPTKAHYIAHYLLYKAYRNRSCIFAFNQMRRVSSVSGKVNCRLYANARKYIAQAISESNSGRPVSDHHRGRISESNTGKNRYRCTGTGEIKQIRTDAVPDGWIPAQTGRVHDDGTKTKIGEANKNRKWCYHQDTYDMKFVHELPDGYILGYDPLHRVTYHRPDDSTWLTNVETRKTIRMDIRSDGIPEGFVKGRGGRQGFTHINDPSMCRMVDLLEKTYVIIARDKLPQVRYIKHASTIEDIVIYEINGVIYTTFSDMKESVLWLPNGLPRSSSIERIIVQVPKLFRADRLKWKEFYEKNQNKTLYQLGVRAIPLPQFDYEARIQDIYVKN